MRTIETKAEVMRVERGTAGLVVLAFGAVGEQRSVWIAIPSEHVRAFADAAARDESVTVRIEVPLTDAQNREAAADMVRDMHGEIEG